MCGNKMAAASLHFRSVCEQLSKKAFKAERINQTQHLFVPGWAFHAIRDLIHSQKLSFIPKTACVVNIKPFC